MFQNQFQRIRPIASFLSTVEIWLVTGSIVVGILSESMLPLAPAVAGLCWVSRWYIHGYVSKRTPADVAIALLTLILPFTLWLTFVPEITRIQVYRLLGGIALYYAIVNWTTSFDRLRFLLVGVVLAGLGLALIAPFSVLWFVNKLSFIPGSFYERFTLLVADTIHPNVLAGNVLILLPFAVTMPFFAWSHLNWPVRLLVGMAALAMTGVLLLTQSRGAIVALLIMLVTIIFLRLRRTRYLLLASSITAVSALLVLYYARQSSSILSMAEKRIEIWSRAVMMIRDFPITGIGMGAFRYMVEVWYTLFLNEPGTIPHAHNLFLQVGVDLGIPGLIAWLAVLMVITVVSWQVYQSGRAMADNWWMGVGAGLLGSQVALVAHGLTDAVTWGMVRPAPLVWAIWGVTIASWNIQQQIEMVIEQPFQPEGVL